MWRLVLQAVVALCAHTLATSHDPTGHDGSHPGATALATLAAAAASPPVSGEEGTCAGLGWGGVSKEVFSWVLPREHSRRHVPLPPGLGNDRREEV
jgi:hypothetical protein